MYIRISCNIGEAFYDPPEKCWYNSNWDKFRWMELLSWRVDRTFISTRRLCLTSRRRSLRFSVLRSLKTLSQMKRLWLSWKSLKVWPEFMQHQQWINFLWKSDIKETKGDEVLCKLGTDLDGKFSSARTAEVNLGNLLADVAMAALQVGEYWLAL